MNKWSYLCLFFSGMFLGGTIDHMVFALLKNPAPYGIKLGIIGNWIMALFDFIVALILFYFFRKKRIVHESK